MDLSRWLVPPRLTSALWLLLALFFCRVAGQLMVAMGWQGFLPPMEEWYSGLMPYRWLLPSQIAILCLCVKICLDLTRRRGFFFDPKAFMGRWLGVFGSFYFLAMVIRYVLRMAVHPEERWFGGTIPIFFHWVLASFVLLLGGYHARAGDGSTPRRGGI